VKVSCRTGLDLGPNLALTLIDVSEDGLRFVARAALKAGDEVTIGLEARGHLRPVKMQGIVVWTSPADEGMLLVGVQFQRRLSYRDLQEMV
jgi:hypothetical protein